MYIYIYSAEDPWPRPLGIRAQVLGPGPRPGLGPGRAWARGPPKLVALECPRVNRDRDRDRERERER